MRVLTHVADCDVLLNTLDRKLAGVINAAAEIRQSLDTQDAQRHKELTAELSRLPKDASVLRSRRDGIIRRKRDLKAAMTRTHIPRVADKRSAGHTLSRPTISRRSAALALENGPQGNT
jgi:hypothetical protein